MRYALFGAGGHAKSLLSGNYKEVNFVALYDDNQVDHQLYAGGFNKMINDLKAGMFDKIHVSIGNNEVRCEIYQRIIEKSDRSCIGNLISLEATVVSEKYDNNGGVFIGARTYIGPDAVISDFTIVNTGAIVEHDCEIGKGSFLGPACTLAGGVIIGEHVFLGVGSTVTNHLTIESDITIGAGATVTKDLVEKGVYIGTPAELR